MLGTPQEALPVSGREASAPWGRVGYSSVIFLRCLDPLVRTAPFSGPVAATSRTVGAFTEIRATGGIKDFPYALLPHRFADLGSEIPTGLAGVFAGWAPGGRAVCSRPDLRPSSRRSLRCGSSSRARGVWRSDSITTCREEEGQSACSPPDPRTHGEAQAGSFAGGRRAGKE